MQIIIGNSYSRATEMTLIQEKELNKLLSYTVGGKAAFFSKYGPRRKSLLSKRGEFPTGLLHLVTKAIKGITLVDQRVEPNHRKLKVLGTWQDVPYEDQMTAVSQAIIHRRGTIAMPTGTGKSLVIALIANALKVKTLVVVPSLEIKKQLVDSLATIFDDTSWLTVENIDSKYLKTAKGYDCLIIDEAHHTAAKTYQKLNKTVWTGIYYRFFMTATPFRNDPEERLLFESIAGEIIFNLSYKDAIKKGYIVPVEAYYIELPKQQTDAYTYAEVYSQLVVHNEHRNAVIANLLKTLLVNSVYTLCLVREVKHGNILSELAMIPFVNGEDDFSRGNIGRFNRGKIRSLIGTEGILGEGIDTKPSEYVIIAGLGKAKSAFMQKVGRAVRKYKGKESAKIIIFKDKSHKFTLRHYREQCKILKEEYGVEPVKLEI